ncbi:MAG TPA: class I SAM-dependent methyltransferase [Trueperaceae bacterium]|nr:class I SAM-dependent methyltransferase [Trueperaceae bacterium]
MIYDADAELYDLQYATYRDDLPFYMRMADDLGSPVLELGAGTGRVTESLARAGHDVVAVDVAGAMLERAGRRLTDAGLAGRVELVEDDMRSLDLGRTFPLVIAPFNTLMHLYSVADQDLALARVRAHLEEGGVFAFDLYVPRFGPMGVTRVEPFWTGQARRAEAASGARGDLFLVQEHDEVAQLLTTTYFLDTVAEDGRLSRSVATLRQRYFTRFELERALAQAGFRLELSGAFDRSRYDERSSLMVGVARAT